MTIEVPREGASVQLVFLGGLAPGQAVIVVTDEVEIRHGTPGSVDTAVVPPTKDAKPSRKPALDLDSISANLVKLRTKRRVGAVNAIRTMFQFTNPITAEAANRILEDLRRRGDLTITAGGGVEFLNQEEAVS